MFSYLNSCKCREHSNRRNCKCLYIIGIYSLCVPIMYTHRGAGGRSLPCFLQTSVVTLRQPHWPWGSPTCTPIQFHSPARSHSYIGVWAFPLSLERRQDRRKNHMGPQQSSYVELALKKLRNHGRALVNLGFGEVYPIINPSVIDLVLSSWLLDCPMPLLIMRCWSHYYPLLL